MPNEYLPENLAELHRANGLYLTFSTSPVPVRLPTSHVRITDEHTKIGYAGQGFAQRANEYRTMLKGRLEFWPIIELPANQLRGMELLVMDVMYERYDGVMLRRDGEWFATTDRQAVKALIVEVVTDRLMELGREQIQWSLRGHEACIQQILERQFHRNPRLRVTPSHLAACAADNAGGLLDMQCKKTAFGRVAPDEPVNRSSAYRYTSCSFGKFCKQPCRE